jgi:HK97 gp10 family phage protein
MNYTSYKQERQRELISKLTRGITKACLLVEGDAKRDCPVDTGRLRSSITHEVDTGEMTGYVETNVDYAPFVELGTYKMPAQPFLFPALEQNKGKIQDMLRK